MNWTGMTRGNRPILAPDELASLPRKARLRLAGAGNGRSSPLEAHRAVSLAGLQARTGTGHWLFVSVNRPRVFLPTAVSLGF